MNTVADLTTLVRKTNGDVPPKLVGASTTVVGDKLYLFGGRLVTERRMVADLYVFDLETFVWQKVPPHADDDVPGARYFHSTDSWNNCLVVFGGMGHRPDATTADDLCVLNDVRFFDLSTRRWLPSFTPSSQNTADPVDATSPDASIDAAQDFKPSSSESQYIPRARYAHLSSVMSGRLFVIGGQDLNNVWLDDVCVFDLTRRMWVARRDYPRHSGTYRSVAVAGNLRVRFPSEEAKAAGGNAENPLGPPGGRYKIGKRPPSSKGEYTPSESLVHLPYSTEPTDEFPNDIYLYSNYNFTDVKRELEVFTPLPGGNDFRLTDRSNTMSGTVLPPGLRFPTGAICGTHLLFAGTYLAHSYQSYSIWALELTTMTWARLDPGSALATGSWFRAALWNAPGKSKFLIFGNRQGNLVEDYNRRLLAWDDVAVIDLEAFGIYQPPRPSLGLRAQELGLAALEESLLADFELVCDDGRRIPCSRKLLEIRWPWFRDQRRLFLDAATRALESIPSTDADVPLPPDPIADKRLEGEEPRPDPRLTPRSLILSEPYPITLALLQYFYTLSLLTPLQHAPAVLSQLMILSVTYNLPDLLSLVKHAMHRALAPTTSVGVYEVATLCSCQSLQIRALKSVMASSKRSGGRNRGNSAGPDGGGGGTDGGGGPHGAARPRGMSDLRGITRPDGAGGGLGSTVTDGGIMNSSRRATGAGPSTIIEATSSNATQARPNAISGPSRSRIKHSVNLSMDSIYLAMKSVDEAYAKPANGYPDAYSAVGSTVDDGTENESESALSPARRKISFVDPSARPTPTPNGRSAPMSSTNRPVSPPNGPRAQSILLSHASAGTVPSRQPSRLGIPRAKNSDSDISHTSTVSSGSSSGRSALSPMTPESPPLRTPAEALALMPMPMELPAKLNLNMPLSSIKEGSVNEETRTSTPLSGRADRDAVQVVAVVQADAGINEEYDWAELKDSGMYIHPPLSSPEPISPAMSNFPASSTSHSGKTSSSEKHSDGKQGGFARQLFSSRKNSKTANVEKGDKMAPSPGESMWTDSREAKKAVKAEEKRRKKEEERRRLDDLAEQLKARSLATSKNTGMARDSRSVFSTNSSERRRLANQWMEDTDGLFGGAVGGWSTL